MDATLIIIEVGSSNGDSYQSEQRVEWVLNGRDKEKNCDGCNGATNKENLLILFNPIRRMNDIRCDSKPSNGQDRRNE
jgi:hypothetical protein